MKQVIIHHIQVVCGLHHHKIHIHVTYSTNHQVFYKPLSSNINLYLFIEPYFVSHVGNTPNFLSFTSQQKKFCSYRYSRGEIAYDDDITIDGWLLMVTTGVRWLLFVDIKYCNCQHVLSRKNGQIKQVKLEGSICGFNQSATITDCSSTNHVTM